MRTRRARAKGPGGAAEARPGETRPGEATPGEATPGAGRPPVGAGARRGRARGGGRGARPGAEDRARAIASLHGEEV